MADKFVYTAKRKAGFKQMISRLQTYIKLGKAQYQKTHK
jgi:hypothetical protein